MGPSVWIRGKLTEVCLPRTLRPPTSQQRGVRLFPPSSSSGGATKCGACGAAGPLSNTAPVLAGARAWHDTSPVRPALSPRAGGLAIKSAQLSSPVVPPPTARAAPHSAPPEQRRGARLKVHVEPGNCTPLLPSACSVAGVCLSLAKAVGPGCGPVLGEEPRFCRPSRMLAPRTSWSRSAGFLKTARTFLGDTISVHTRPCPAASGSVESLTRPPKPKSGAL